jgi:hypothetical protein
VKFVLSKGITPAALNAEGIVYDIGHLLALPTHRRTNAKLPMTYGANIYSLTEAQRAAGMNYNCTWRTGDHSKIRGWEVTRRIEIGEELLGKYNVPIMVGDVPLTFVARSAGMQTLPLDLFRFGKRWSFAEHDIIPTKGYCGLLIMHSFYLRHNCKSRKHSADLSDEGVCTTLADFAVSIISAILLGLEFLISCSLSLITSPAPKTWHSLC